MRSTI